LPADVRRRLCRVRQYARFGIDSPGLHCLRYLSRNRGRPSG
jgi:hypothetical protein